MHGPAPHPDHPLDVVEHERLLVLEQVQVGLGHAQELARALALHVDAQPRRGLIDAVAVLERPGLPCSALRNSPDGNLDAHHRVVEDFLPADLEVAELLGEFVRPWPRPALSSGRTASGVIPCCSCSTFTASLYCCSFSLTVSLHCHSPRLVESRRLLRALVGDEPEGDAHPSFCSPLVIRKMSKVNSTGTRLLGGRAEPGGDIV